MWWCRAHVPSASPGRARKRSSRWAGGFVGEVQVTKTFWHSLWFLTFSEKKINKTPRLWLKYPIASKYLTKPGPIFTSAREVRDLDLSLWLLGTFLNTRREFNPGKCRMSY